MRKFVFIHFLFFIVIACFSKDPWPYLMLTIAQIFYVPIALRFVLRRGDWLFKYYFYFAIPAYVSVAIIQLFSPEWAAISRIHLFRIHGLHCAIRNVSLFTPGIHQYRRVFNRSRHDIHSSRRRMVFCVCRGYRYGLYSVIDLADGHSLPLLRIPIAYFHRTSRKAV